MILLIRYYRQQKNLLIANVLKLILNDYSNFIDWDVPNWSRAHKYLDSKKSASFKDKKVIQELDIYKTDKNRFTKF